MGQKTTALSAQQRAFISEQKIFFVGTATAESRVNISPKGMDSLRILDDNCVAWLNVTGSGNETAAHVQHNPRMTLLFCAFEGNPLILRLYGSAQLIHQQDADWDAFAELFPPLPGSRQIFVLTVDLVHSSCGMGVPYFSYVAERELLADWATKKGSEGLQKYWQEKNTLSIDGIPTHILAKKD